MKNDLPDRLDKIEQMLYLIRRDMAEIMSHQIAITNHLHVPDDLVNDDYETVRTIQEVEEDILDYCPHCGGHHSKRATAAGWKCTQDPAR